MHEITDYDVCEKELHPCFIDPFLAAVATAGAELVFGDDLLADKPEYSPS